jgi:glucose/arabinose dehydrogenase
LSVHPAWAVEGARVTVRGPHFEVRGAHLPAVSVGGVEARVVMGATTRLTFLVPPALARGPQPVTVDGVTGRAVLHVGTALTTGIHQVDNPAIDADGYVFLTHSGARGQRVPVSVYRVSSGGAREDYLSDIVNATALAFDPGGVLHVSSRFDGAVYRVTAERRVEPVATDLGVACGIAFGPDGTLFVGDRTGTIFRIGPAGRALPFATLPSSMAAFHLASGPEGRLYVTAPTLGTYDSVYMLERTGSMGVLSAEFGRPQGLAVDEHGDVYVVEALAGSAGLYRLRAGRPRELVLAAPALVGVALDPRGGLVVSSNDTAYRLDVPVKPFPVFHA